MTWGVCDPRFVPVQGSLSVASAASPFWDAPVLSCLPFHSHPSSPLVPPLHPPVPETGPTVPGRDPPVLPECVRTRLVGRKLGKTRPSTDVSRPINHFTSRSDGKDKHSPQSLQGRRKV